MLINNKNIFQKGSSLFLIILFVLLIIGGVLLVYELVKDSVAITTPQLEERMIKEANESKVNDETMEESILNRGSTLNNLK